MKLGSYNIVIRPALLVLVGACIVGAVAIPTFQHLPSKVSALPEFGYVDPTHWKFETRSTANAMLTGNIATASGDKNEAAPATGTRTFLKDIRDAICVDVSNTGPSPDCIYLRNGLNVTQMEGTGNLYLRFEAAAPKPFSLSITVRDSRTLLWHQMVAVNGTWQPFQLEIPADSLKNRANNNLILAVQMGFQTGRISVRNIQIKDK